MLWVGFNAFILMMLALDLGIFNRRARAFTIKEALWWSAFWIALSMVFNVLIYFTMGADLAVQFFSGYIVEKSLSVDNLFVIALIFSYFRVPAIYQHKVLFWGIIGALVMRGGFIVGGLALVTKFTWMFYLFGALLIYSGIKIFFTDEDDEIEPEKNLLIRGFKKLMPVTPAYHEGHFFVKINERTFATPLFVALLMVEFTDLLFAVDSIPAVLAISQDTFIVYASNAFAILGLRSLYFALAGIIQLFDYLKYGLAAVLVFIGIKLMLHDVIHIPTSWALLFILFALSTAILASIVSNHRKRKQQPEEIPEEQEEEIA
jgi:tellurite resistance protein TerC